ncbi:hypothetical protein ASPZODRAFT_17794 [Penicilliopsis zonata CBS 506.65]|uniref:Uncharacterized protein n=1 Tax=Penicilliopsis zonata CBS 506.65 TaxID=1073090 RepID=A0A1L9SCD8_9EURO|nr:hypothetical protein ASPZODRAFT_17794 [Penicilliopsis zonata CBS 506.65]OJJ44880.1 hypothetical protein ASPZODRAFT_17794 [Penicilliopsis zonata CBS 506.65]
MEGSVEEGSEPEQENQHADPEDQITNVVFEQSPSQYSRFAGLPTIQENTKLTIPPTRYPRPLPTPPSQENTSSIPSGESHGGCEEQTEEGEWEDIEDVYEAEPVRPTPSYIACSHSTVTRQRCLGASDVCPECKRFPPLGYLYACTEDETDLLAKPDCEFLSPRVLRAIEAGEYTEEQKIQLFVAKHDVLEAACDARRQKLIAPYYNHRMAVGLGDMYADCHSDATAQHFLRMTPARLRRGTSNAEPCHHRVCHYCRPYLVQMSWVSLNAVLEDPKIQARADPSNSNRLVARADVVRNLGTRVWHPPAPPSGPKPLPPIPPTYESTTEFSTTEPEPEPMPVLGPELESDNNPEINLEQAPTLKPKKKVRFSDEIELYNDESPRVPRDELSRVPWDKSTQVPKRSGWKAGRDKIKNRIKGLWGRKP